MARGKKSSNEVINEKVTSNTAEMAAEIAPPIANEGVTPKADDKKKSTKPKGKAGRKPKAADTKAKKAVAAEKADMPVKTTTSSDKAKSKAGRKPKANSTKTEKSAAAAKANTNTKTTTKTGRKPSTKKADTVAPAAAEKKKRAYNKKANSAKAENIIIQSNGGEYTMSDINEICKSDYRNGSRKRIKSIKVYIKAENNSIRAYYVVNDNANGYVDL